MSRQPRTALVKSSEAPAITEIALTPFHQKYFQDRNQAQVILENEKNVVARLLVEEAGGVGSWALSQDGTKLVKQ